MADDIKFAWDKNRHDSGIPPKEEVLSLVCPKCNKRLFTQVVTLTKTIVGPNTFNVQAGVAAFACIGCNHVFKLEDLQGVREGSNVTPFGSPKKA